MELFGYQITKKSQPIPPTPVTPLVDGSSVINSSRMSGYYGYGFNFDIDGTVRNEVQMINRYREIATYPDCDAAIEQIVNEAVIVDQARAPVELNLDQLPEQYNDSIKDCIRTNFEKILSILDFNDNCHDIFKRWYIDGKLYYYVMVDSKAPQKGIVDIKYVDPRKIRKVVEYIRELEDGISVIKDIKEYYIFNDNGLDNAQQGIRVSTDSIIYVKSGLVDAASGEVISHLFKAIKPVNQLKMMEDALVIYRITRAPERRVFYVDVGNLPAQKAEQYVSNIMNKFRNKVVYDAETGEIKNNRNYMSMCLAMDTKVPLLDGRTLSIREIAAEVERGEQLWAYSCHPTTGKVVPGKISWAGVTQKSANVIRITLDNGKTITCTPDHKFPIKDVGFVRADQLKVNDSLMPLYRRHQQIDSAYKNEYEQYYDNEDHQWYFTHRKVVEYTQLDEQFEHKRVIHHADLNRYNNSPENLVQMDWQEHRALHNKLGFRYKEKMEEQGRLDEWKQWKSDVGYGTWVNRTEQEKIDHIKTMTEGRYEYYDQLKENGEWKQYCEKFTHCGVTAQQIRKEQMKDPEWVAQFKKNCKKAQNDPELRLHKLSIAEAKFHTIIDDDIAKFAFDFLSTSRRGTGVCLTKLVQVLNSNEVLLQRFRDINFGRLHSAEDKTFNITSLKGALVRYFNVDSWEHLLNIIPKSETRAVIDEDIAKFVVDLYKQYGPKRCTAKFVASILNGTEWVLSRMDQLNGRLGKRIWPSKFTSDNVVTLVTRYFGFTKWSEFKNNANYLNHRIASIEVLDDPIEVGCLTIDRDHEIHDYHTFALESGVFVKNCEDFWLPRREGGKATEITTLPGGQALDSIADVQYFQNKLYQALNVPKQRLLPDNMFNLGTTAEITREEVLFAKFIQRLRNNFNTLFKEALRLQLICTRVLKASEWDKISNLIHFEYQHDNYFEELKRIEVWNERMSQLQNADSFKGTYFSREWIVKNVLQLGDEEWSEIKDQIATEAAEEEGLVVDPDEEGVEDDVYGDEESSPDKVEQSDNPDELDNTVSDMEPNVGEDDFDREGEPGLVVRK